MTSSRPISSADDLRRYPRKNILEWPVLSFEMLAAADVRPLQSHRGVLLNLSEGGLGLQPFRPLAPGAVGWVQLGVPGADKPLVSDCRVAWVGRNGSVGISFIEPSAEARDLLRRWLSHKPLRQSYASAVSIEFLPAELNEFETALQLIAERAKLVSRASGVAIAVGDNRSMECRASSGTAPDVGTILRAGSGLSGHCLSEGKIVNCVDVRSDARVDAAAARQLEMRSALILPVSAAGEITGLLEAFSPRPHAFDKRQVTRLKLFAGLIGSAIEERLAECGNPEHAFTGGDSSLSEANRPTPFLAESVSAGNGNPPEVDTAGTTAVADFPMMSYVDSPSFQSPLLVAKISLGFVLFAAVTSFGWHAVQSHGKPPATPVAAGDVSEQGDGSEQQIVLKLGPSKIVKKVGATFTVDVTLDGAKNLSSVPLELRYDPKLLQFVSVSNGDLLSKDGQSVALVHREQGSAIQVTATRPPSAPGAAGNGTVFTLVFLAKAPGKSSLSIKPSTLRDSKMNAISVDSADATVTIRG